MKVLSCGRTHCVVWLLLLLTGAGCWRAAWCVRINLKCPQIGFTVPQSCRGSAHTAGSELGLLPSHYTSSVPSLSGRKRGIWRALDCGGSFLSRELQGGQGKRSARVLQIPAGSRRAQVPPPNWQAHAHTWPLSLRHIQGPLLLEVPESVHPAQASTSSRGAGAKEQPHVTSQGLVGTQKGSEFWKIKSNNKKN